jgi:hypothetical protein
MQASIKAEKNGTVIAVLDAEAARTTFACVIFAARIHEEIVPLARIMEQQLQIEGVEVNQGDARHAGDASRTR